METKSQITACCNLPAWSHQSSINNSKVLIPFQACPAWMANSMQTLSYLSHKAAPYKQHT